MTTGKRYTTFNEFRNGIKIYYVKDEQGEFKTTGTSSQEVADYLADFLNKQDEQIEELTHEVNYLQDKLDEYIFLEKKYDKLKTENTRLKKENRQLRGR